MSAFDKTEFARLYAGFHAPIAALNCGDRCAPHNEHAIPFCCDTRHVVPTAYLPEWAYLQESTDLWHAWGPSDAGYTPDLQEETPPNQALIACQGHQHCQRSFRALVCRAFPFFPYISEEGVFAGLSAYLDFRDRCWVISHLEVVSAVYRQEFIQTFDLLFERLPEEREGFAYHSAEVRRQAARSRQTLILLHRDGGYFKISHARQNKASQMKAIAAEALPRYGVYRLADDLPFPDELP